MDKLIVGCGYLGKRVAALWLAEGHRVFGTTRNPQRATELRQLGIEPVSCDLFDASSLRTLPTADVILYCVGFDRGAGRSMREVYVEGLANFLARGPSSPSRFLHVSSTGVYGQSQGEEVTEASATEPPEESGQVMLAAERMLQDSRPDAMVLRCSGIYGPGRLLRRQAIEAGEPLVGDADKWLNLIHVADGAAAILAAEARSQPGRVHNVSDNQPVRRRDFYTLLARLLNAPEPRFVPVGPGDPLPSHERANRRVSNRRLREELGVQLRYPSFEQGLLAAVGVL